MVWRRTTDIRHPTDSDLAADVVKVLARTARKVHAAIPGLTRKVRDRSRAAGKRTRELGRTLARRTGDAKQQVQRLTEEIAALAKASLGKARRLLAEAQLTAARVGRRSRRRMRRVVAELEEMIVLGGKVVDQIRQRFAGEKIAIGNPHEDALLRPAALRTTARGEPAGVWPPIASGARDASPISSASTAPGVRG